MPTLVLTILRKDVTGPPWVGWQYDEATFEFYTPKIQGAIHKTLDGVPEAIREAKQAHSYLPTFKAPAPNGPGAISGQVSAQAVQSNVFVNQEALDSIYASIYGDAYLIGTHAAAQVLGTDSPGAVIFLSALDQNTDWENWTPGNPRAALQAADGGLARLLADRNIAIQGVSNTTLNRIGDLIAQGLDNGDSTQTIERAVRDFVTNPIRAEMIARTETARAVTQATFDTYRQAGVTEWLWLVAPDACPICQRNGYGGPYPLGGGPYMPAHPRCRCAALPVVKP